MLSPNTILKFLTTDIMFTKYVVIFLNLFIFLYVSLKINLPLKHSFPNFFFRFLCYNFNVLSILYVWTTDDFFLENLITYMIILTLFMIYYFIKFKFFSHFLYYYLLYDKFKFYYYFILLSFLLTCDFSMTLELKDSLFPPDPSKDPPSFPDP